MRDMHYITKINKYLLINQYKKITSYDCKVIDILFVYYHLNLIAMVH